MARSVILVCGPPCAGKSTYVEQHARPGDVVLDQDVIGPARMRAGLAKLPMMFDGRAWVIRCAPGPAARQALARRIGATDVVLLVEDEAELIARAGRRPNPRRHIQAVRDWFEREAKPRRASVQRGEQTKRATTTQRGYGWAHQKARAQALRDMRDGQPCPRCDGPMWRRDARLLDLDHTPDRTAYRGLAHRGCNRAAGQAVAVARVRARKREQLNVTNSRHW